MCGLVGVAGNTVMRDMKIFRDMLIFDQVRGFDSTGVAAVGVNNNDTSALVEKTLDGPDNLWVYLGSKIFDSKGVTNGVKRLLMGHNRAATVGKVTEANAHPFQFGHITGAHNGSLVVWDDLVKDQGGKDYDVDSKAIFATIAEKGIDYTWKNFIGAAALTWWDAKDGTLNIIRNEERPLYYAFSTNGDVMYWASEEWMIRIACARHNAGLKSFEHTHVATDGTETKVKRSIFQFEPHKLAKFEVKSTSIKLVEERELEKKTKEVSRTAQGGGTSTQTTSGTNSARTAVVTAVNGYRPQPTLYNLPDDHQFPLTWAKGLPKADKEVRGMQFEYERVVHVSQGDRYRPYCVGRLITPVNKVHRIEIFPNTMGELREFLDENPTGGRMYILGARPRVQSYKSPGNLPWSFRIAMEQLKLAPVPRAVEFEDVLAAMRDMQEKEEPEDLYPVYGGNLVAFPEWRNLISRAGGCCAYCGSGLHFEEAKQMHWIDATSVLCAECNENGWGKLGVL